MTVSTNDRRLPYPGNGVATEFPGPRIFTAADLVAVLVNNATGAVTTLAEFADYTVSGLTLGQSVVHLYVPPPVGTTLLLLRTLSFTQGTRFSNQGAFFANLHEDALDRAAMRDQQLFDRAERTLHFRDDVLLDPDVSMELPAPSPLGLIGWDITGKHTQVFSPDTFAAGVSAGLPFDFQVLPGQTVIDTSGIPGQWMPYGVFYNGIYQGPTDYVRALNGSTITFTSPLPAAGKVTVQAVFVTPDAPASADLIGTTLVASGAVSRTARDKAGDHVSVQDFGAVGNGVSNDNTWIANAINNRPAGAAVRFPRGRYLVVGRIDVSLTSNLTLEFETGAVLIGDAASNLPVITLRGGAGRYRVTVRGGQFDNGDRVFNPALQSGTALDLIDLDDFVVDGCVFGRKTRDWSDNLGDSGITATRCQRGKIANSTFYGQPDLGIYVTGGSSAATTDDYGDIVVSSNVFYRCNAGVSSKRGLARMIVLGNTFVECKNGATVFEAGGVGSGRCGVIANNVFKSIQSFPIRVHGDGGFAITGNVIEDFGYDRALVATGAYGIWLYGAGNNTITGNVIRFKDWATTAAHYAMRAEQATIDGTTYTPANNHVADNLILNVYNAFKEVSCGVSSYINNSLIGVTNPFATMNTGMNASYWDGTIRRSAVGGVLLPESGTYTPVAGLGTNMSAASGYVSQWSREGRVVTVSGRYSATCTANSTASIVRLSLPIARVFTAAEQLSGLATPIVPGGGTIAAMQAEVGSGSDEADVRFTSGGSSTTARDWVFQCTYLL